jgi:hypothetical protein
MFPLRATHGVSRFPWGTGVLVSLLVVAELLVRVMPGTRIEGLIQATSVPAAFQISDLGDWSRLASSFFLSGNLFALWITCLYAWSFLPALFERDSILWSLVGSTVVTLAAFFAYRAYHGEQALAPLLLSQVWMSAFLGLAMRHEIWDSVTTLVLYQKGVSLFEVPSYVLLFFWFFYIMVGNLFLDPPFNDAPTIYFLPLTAFILGFVVESLRLKFKPLSDTRKTVVI